MRFPSLLIILILITIMPLAPLVAQEGDPISQAIQEAWARAKLRVMPS